MKRRFYLASPFFNDAQVSRVRDVEKIIEDGGHLCYSPSRDGIKLEIGKSTYEDRKATFDDNVNNILESDAVIAIMDEPDTGTSWEVGLALRENIPVYLCYLDNQSSMEFGIGATVIVGREDVSKLMRQLSKFVVGIVSPNADQFFDKLCSRTDEFKDFALEIFKSQDAKDYDIFNKYDLVVCDIDDRDINVAKIIGKCYNSKKLPKVTTYTNNDYGVNLMLLHSIACHCKSLDEALDYIKQCCTEELVKYDDHYVKNTKEFE